MKEQQYSYNVPDSVKDNPRVQQWYDTMVADAAGDTERLLHNLKAVCGYLIQVDNLLTREKKRNEHFVNLTKDIETALTQKRNELANDRFAKVFGMMGIAAEPQAKYGK